MSRDSMEDEGTAGSSRRRGGVIISYINAVASMIVSLLYVPILLSGIGQDEYGLYQLIGSLISYMSIMSYLLQAGTTRFYCVAFAKGDIVGMERVLATCRLIFRFAAVVAIAAGFVFIWLFTSIYDVSLTEWQVAEGAAMIAILVANMIVTMNNTISVAVINANERFVFLKSSQLVQTIAQPLFIVLLVYFWPYATTIVAVQLGLNIALALGQHYYSRRILGARIEMHGLDKVLLRSIFVFMGGLLAASIADTIFWRTNQLILGYYYGASVVAIYGIASQIYSAFLSLGNVIASVFMPRVSQLFSKADISGISDLYARVGRLSLYVLLFIFGVFCVVGRDFITLWAGPEYADAYWIALIIMVAFTLDSSQSLGITILQVMNIYRFRAWVYFILAVANIAIVLVVAPAFGGIGCAAVSCVLMLLGNGVVMNVYYHRVARMDMIGWWHSALRVILPLAFFIVASCITWNIIDPPISWGSIIIGGFGFLTLFFVVSRLFCMNAYERGLLHEAITRLSKPFEKKHIVFPRNEK